MWDTNNTTIRGNGIGLGWDNALPNGQHGIWDYQSVQTIIADNTISGNMENGITLQGASNAQIYSNVIGQNWAHNAATPNLYNGIRIFENANNISIGGTIPEHQNIVYANGTNGISLEGNAHDISLQYNQITDNTLNGVYLNNAHNVSFLASDNFGQNITNNDTNGIYAVNTHLYVYGGNNISNNSAHGIYLQDVLDSTFMSVKLNNNGGNGITIVNTTLYGSNGNLILPYQAMRNTGIAIDLGNNGVTVNGTHAAPPNDGPNSWLPYPELTEIVEGIAYGTSLPNSTVTLYPAIYGNPSTGGGGPNGPGVDVTANASGNWQATLNDTLLTQGFILQTTRVNENGSLESSEFSPWYGIATEQKIFLPLVTR